MDNPIIIAGVLCALPAIIILSVALYILCTLGKAPAQPSSNQNNPSNQAQVDSPIPGLLAIAAVAITAKAVHNSIQKKKDPLGLKEELERNRRELH